MAERSPDHADPLPSGSDLHQLRAFVAVGTALSFSRAAEQLRVTPQALSQQVRGLEERIGIQLLHRTTRSVALTEAGRHLFDRAQGAVAQLGSALSDTRAANGRVAGTVRIHAFRTALERHIEPILGEFHRLYPDVVVDLTVDDEVLDIVSGGFDAAMRVGEVIQQDMIAVRLGEEMRQIAIATPAYLAAHGVPAHPSDLVRHRCVRWRWDGHSQPYAWEFFENGSWFEVVVNGPLIVNDKDSAIRATLKGIGIGFASEEMVRHHVAAGRLIPLLEPWCAPFPGMFLCYPRQRRMAPALRAFIDAVRDPEEMAARVA
ncbi:MAG: LysR family transcriptional regulator [Pseudomonadota bacterium]